MAKLFFGKPANPGEMRFHVATLLNKGGQPARHDFNRHEITGLYGIQIGNSFIGVVSFGRWGASTIPESPAHDQ